MYENNIPGKESCRVLKRELGVNQCNEIELAKRKTEVSSIKGVNRV